MPVLPGMGNRQTSLFEDVYPSGTKGSCVSRAKLSGSAGKIEALRSKLRRIFDP
jgi:hypothetical protein